jgi:hypothetical protein
MSDLEKLHEAVFNITPLVLQEEYLHMKTPWQMVLGGLILPEIARLDPSVLDADPTYKALMEQYTKEQVIEFFAPKIETKEVIKEVTKEIPVTKVVEKIVKVPTGGTTIIESSGKYRRLKSGVAKVKRFERELDSADRDVFILRWNKLQRLVTDDDPICKELADEINKGVGTPLSPMQVAGYFSYLCRLGMWAEADREGRIDRSVKRGAFTVRPIYSPELLKQIADNWEKQRADEAVRAEAHTKLREARARGEKIRIKTPVEGTTVVSPAPTPEPVAEPEEEFDIRFM